MKATLLQRETKYTTLSASAVGGVRDELEALLARGARADVRCADVRCRNWTLRFAYVTVSTVQPACSQTALLWAFHPPPVSASWTSSPLGTFRKRRKKTSPGSFSFEPMEKTS
eukprot:3648675-Pleurochrysis_carterae.AAC.1